MKNEFQYGYLMAGHGQARLHRMTLMERIRLWRRRRRQDDLAGMRGWVA